MFIINEPQWRFYITITAHRWFFSSLILEGIAHEHPSLPPSFLGHFSADFISQMIPYQLLKYSQLYSGFLIILLLWAASQSLFNIIGYWLIKFSISSSLFILPLQGKVFWFHISPVIVRWIFLSNLSIFLSRLKVRLEVLASSRII